MLITQRNLCTQIQFGDCITRIPLPPESEIDYSDPFVDEPPFDLGPLYEVQEFHLGNVDPVAPPIFGYARRKALVRKIQATMVNSASSPFRYKLGTVGYLQSNYLQKRLAKILPKKLLNTPVNDLAHIDEEIRDQIPKELLIKDLLTISPKVLARRMKIPVSDALKIKGSLFETKLQGR